MEIIPPKHQGPARPYDSQSPVTPLEPAPYTAGQPTGLTPSNNDPDKHRSWRGVASTIGLLFSAFLIAILLNTFVIQSYQVDGQSMETTLQNNDRLIVNKIPRTLSRIDGRQFVPKRGDIIIFNQVGLPGFVGQKQLIKRVIGLPGERVVVAAGKITIYNNTDPNGFNPDTTGDYRIAA